MVGKSCVRLSALAIALGAAMGGVAVAEEMAGNPYVTSKGDKAPVVNSYGECWPAKGATKQMLEACGDVIAQEEPKPEPVAVDGDVDGDGVPNSRDKCPNTPAGAKVDRDGCTIVENLVINLVEDEFDFDSAVLKPGMKAALDDLAARIEASPGYETVSIVGHTDSTGPEAYNQGLSERRAKAAADDLRGKGITISDADVSGMGESSPIADNGTREGRAQNRRVEISTR